MIMGYFFLALVLVFLVFGGTYFLSRKAEAWSLDRRSKKEAKIFREAFLQGYFGTMSYLARPEEYFEGASGNEWEKTSSSIIQVARAQGAEKARSDAKRLRGNS